MPKNAKKPVYAWFALRRTLPPWKFEETLAEAVRVLPKYGVDEIIVKVDTEEFSHGQPSIEWLSDYQKCLFRIKEGMDKLGIVFSINPWVTQGHADRGRDARKTLPGLQTMVGHNGVECTACVCPLSDVWREHIARLWSIYAQTRPNVIWVEDDIRTFNHRPVEYGCFCPLHLAEFGRRVGKTVTREEVVAAVLKPGEPHPWRAQWLDMQAEIMIDTVGHIARAVHAVSPETHLGLMSSGPIFHCLEGRRWQQFAEALADGVGLYSRPPMYNYFEETPRELYTAADLIKATRFVLPKKIAGRPIIEQAEVDSGPWTRYSKSLAYTYNQVALALALGCEGVTLNLFDQVGTLMETEPEGRTLGSWKPMLDCLAERTQRPGIYRGVRLPFAEKSAYFKQLHEGSGYGDLAADGIEAMNLLERLGVPTTYETSETVVAATGQTLRAFSDDEIRKLLSGGLLLDSAAAKVLVDRGFAREIGLESLAEPACIDRFGTYAAEEFFNPDFGGAERDYLTMSIPNHMRRPSMSILQPAEGAAVISRLVDPDTVRHHVAMYAFENALGGRVAVQALDLASSLGVAYYNTIRQRQIQNVMMWLSRGRLPVVCRGGVFPLALRKDIDGASVLAMFNLSMDPWPMVEWDIADGRKIAGLEVLHHRPRWQKSAKLTARRRPGRQIIRYAAPVPFDQPVFVTVHWK